MSGAREAMSTWIGTLSRGGIIHSTLEEAGLTVAAYVIGEERLGELREWMQAQPEAVLVAHQVAAVQVCIWMAHADREVTEEEAAMLDAILTHTDLPPDTRAALRAEIEDPPSLEGVEERLTNPIVRELLVALSWELASADGRVDRAEEQLAVGVARRLGVGDERCAELRVAVEARLSAAPA